MTRYSQVAYTSAPETADKVPTSSRLHSLFEDPISELGHEAQTLSAIPPGEILVGGRAVASQYTSPGSAPGFESLIPRDGLLDPANRNSQLQPTDALSSRRRSPSPAMDMRLDASLENQWLPRTMKPLPRRRGISVNKAEMPLQPGPGPSLGFQSGQGEGALSVDAAPGLLLPTPLRPLDPPDHVIPHPADNSLLGWHSPVSSEGSSPSLPIFSPESSSIVDWSNPSDQESPSVTSADSAGYMSAGYSTPASRHPTVSDADDEDGNPFKPSGKDPTFWRWMDAVYVRLGERLESHYRTAEASGARQN
ncbi:uncharacterized protein B0H18DRAFT_1114946 [Fomitopsis serialis]|uniref:uncharacterized protein n=1 Tax=Fomitopsis serialis TaxID=139415 RepID=UPI0020073EF0|nr:uncharacterized protein B0H18DRAFT_1114946 [Neoantrodia serialis]KAH9934207.1 hypothetical protein B0H18DRAFT_1114946 [Neoantrodia serialis]